MSGMPSQPDAYYQYLQAHHQSDDPLKNWTVDWLSLAWMWGFMIVISVLTLLWIQQYRHSRQSEVYEVDTWSGYATEIARPASRFFIILSVVITAFAVVLIAGHLIWGQKF